MRVLGIETSCDETAAAVVELVTGEGGQNSTVCRLLSNVVASSMDLHAQYGGVVPEIAARSHMEFITPVIEQALAKAFPTTNYRLPTTQFDPWGQIDAIAVTYGAGLGGSLLVGVLTARTLAITKNKPLYAINHVEGHIYANFLTETPLPQYVLPAKQPQFPMLGLIVSGGHSQLALWRDHHDYTLLGQTQDDAIGEAFDKVAKILGLPYPGGPSIGQAAKAGDPHAFEFPKAKMTSVSSSLEQLRSEVGVSTAARSDAAQGAGETRTEPYQEYGEGALQPATQRSAENPGRLNGSAGKLPRVASGSGYDFSFSGLKTAVLRAAQAQVGKTYELPSSALPGLLNETQKANIAASFQRVAVETVVDKTVMAYEEFRPKSVVIGGGVAASPELRRQLAERLPAEILYTDPHLCTDNAAMIAALGCFTALHDLPTADPYTLNIAPNLSM